MRALAKAAAQPARYVEIGPKHAGQRLDNFLLATLKGVPRTYVYRIVRRGEVRVNRGRARPDHRLQPGDRVRIPPVRTRAPAAARAGGEGFGWLAGRTLYEDDTLLVVDKPAGIAVHGGSGVAVGLIEALRASRPADLMLELVHRLDRGTSGCLLLAKTRPALTALHRALRSGDVDKRYTALVKGTWRGPARSVSLPLETHRRPAVGRVVQVGPQGREAISEFTPARAYAGATLVEIALHTGRMHQARVHAAHIGHPIAGDDKYGDRTFNRRLRGLGLRRLFLHASRLCFVHPVRNARICVESPLPSELSGVAERVADEMRVADEA